MTLPTLSLTSWAGITAAFALLAGAWRYVVSAFKWISTLFVCRVVVRDDAARAVMSHVWRHGRKSPFGLRLFSGIQTFVSPKKRVEVIAYEGITSEPLLFLFGRIPVLVGNGFSRGGNNDEPNVGSWSDDCPPVTLRFIRGTLNVDAMIEEAVTAYNALRQSRRDFTQKKAKRFNVFRMHGSGGYGVERSNEATPKSAPRYAGHIDPENVVQQLHHGELRLLTWKPEELVEKSNDAAPFLNHPVAPEILAEFDEIQTWLSHENWFRSKGVPWRRGYLLHGPTGSGKSMIVRNLAILHDLPIYSFDLSTYDNKSFASDWKTVMQNAPAIALLEDFDVVFKGRENLAVAGKNRDGLAFDCLLNTISGVGSSDGVLLFITTNHIENLDPALGVPRNGDSQSSRPGRIDKAVYVGPIATRERQKVCEVVLSDWPELHAETVAAGEGETAAQFQDRCVQIASKRFWEAGVKGNVERPPIHPRPELIITGKTITVDANGNTTWTQN